MHMCVYMCVFNTVECRVHPRGRRPEDSHTDPVDEERGLTCDGRFYPAPWVQLVQSTHSEGHGWLSVCASPRPEEARVLDEHSDS